MMDRLLYLRVQVAAGCVSAGLNGVPVLRQIPAGCSRVLPIHEFLRTGRNQLEVRIEGNDPALARAQLLLVRTGQAIAAGDSQLLADVQAGSADAPAGAGSLWERELDLPVNFPLWRWMSLIPTALGKDASEQLAQWLPAVAEDLARAQFEPLLEQSRLRSQELGLAYRRDPREVEGALRQRLVALHAAGGLRWPDNLNKDLYFAPVAGGRLLECLGKDGQAALSTRVDAAGVIHRFPLRVAVFDGSIHVLR